VEEDTSDLIIRKRQCEIWDLLCWRPFREYLAEKAVVRERYVPYFLRWVSECYALLDLPLETRLNSDQRQEFLRYLSKRQEDWQVKQAEHALRLYDYFLSLRLEASEARQTGAPQAWQSLEGRMREALRLRHRSLSTERTYLGWLRSFRGLVGDKEPGDLSASDIRNFLSSLAVERRVSGATTSIQRPFKRRSRRRCWLRGFPRRHRFTPCGTASQPTCWKTATTSEPYRNSSATGTSRPP